MKIIYPFKEEAFVTKALSEKLISMDYLDVSRRQNQDEFQNYLKPTISFAAEDFLILIDEEVDHELTTNKLIDLHRVSQFGWYYEKRHRVNSQIFAENESAKIKNLLGLNPSIRIDSFDKLRDDFERRKKLNMLTGALALCYHCFKADYDSLFSKVKMENGVWNLYRSELDPKNDFVILLQLNFINNPNDKKNNRTLFPQEKALHLLHDFLSASMCYFLENNYSMSDFLSYLSHKLATDPECSPLIKGFSELNELYVQKGLSVAPSNKLAIAVKEFLDIAKTDSDKLRIFLDNDRNLSKTSVFLLGMLHLGDRLENQFVFDNFIPSIVDIVSTQIRDIRVTDDKFSLEFDERFVTKNRNKKYNYVVDYISELQQLNQLKSDIVQLQLEKTEVEAKKATLQPEIAELKQQIETMKFQRETNVSQRLQLENENQKELGNINQVKSALDKNQQELEKLKSEKKEIDAKTETLKNEVTKLKQQIETLDTDIRERQKSHKNLIMENEKLVSECTRLETENQKLKREINTLDQTSAQSSQEKKKAPQTSKKSGQKKQKKNSKSPNTTGLF